MCLLIGRLGKVECNQRDFVDGAVLVDVGVGGRAEQTGLDVIKGPWQVQYRKTLTIIHHYSQVGAFHGQINHNPLFDVLI